nr:Bor family protein [Leptospira semungkisensis]
MDKRILLLLYLFACVCILSNCRHAWVNYPQRTPEPCRLYQDSKECRLAMEERNGKKSQQGEVHSISQKYYLFGLYPSDIIVNVAKYCPAGPKSAHQFQSFWDGFWEQVTLTIYSPRTLEIECYPI